MTLLRMLAFRPAETQSGSASGSAPVTVQKTPAVVAPVQATTGKSATGNDDPAQAARAAFDALTDAKTGGPVTSEEPKSEASVQQDERAETEPATDWNTLQSSLKLAGAARELARNFQFESSDNNRWKFLVPDTLQHLGSDKVVQSLQSALSERLGHSVMLDLHTASKPLESVAAATEAAEISRMSEAERAINEDLTVQQLKEKFAAKVVPDSIQPIQ